MFYLLGAAIVWNYPITEARQAEIRREIEQKAAGQARDGAAGQPALRAVDR
jgi:Na+/melibiose symporter-like transporter